jgi:hypothetical protein
MANAAETSCTEVEKEKYVEKAEMKRQSRASFF